VDEDPVSSILTVLKMIAAAISGRNISR